jgi:uncharacterized protein (DUF2384 family)
MSEPSVARQSEGRSSIPVTLDVFMPMAEAWGLSTDEQIRLLGSPPRSSYFKWKKDNGALPRDTAERVSNFLAIWKALEILYPEQARAEAWIRRPNEFFGGASALDVMLADGNFFDIVRVRQYLDAHRGG